MVKGIVRHIDDLGRVVIPKEIRKSLNISDGDPLDIYLKDGVISMRKPRVSCVCCGCEDEEILLMNRGVLICPACVDGFRRS